MAADGKRPVYRFSHFELDAQNLELRKHGVRIKLQEQPFRLLEALLDQPGTLVTREELHAKLWPDETFVDFDHGLNAAAARLRQSLNDSARLPRFIESVPRRGYRFIASVEIVEPAESNGGPNPVVETPQPQRQYPKLRSRFRIVSLLIVMLVVSIVGSIWWLQYRAHPPAVQLFRFTIAPPDGTNFIEAEPVVLSPDGRYMVFPAADNSGEPELWLRPLDEVSARKIEGTKGAAFPFWSRDSRSIAFFARERLYRIEIAGGMPKIVCPASDGRGGAWNRDNQIVFAPSLKSPLYRVPATGGEPAALTSLDASRQEISHRWPAFLPDGQHFLFVIRTADPRHSGIYVGSLRDGRRDLLIPNLSNAVYAADESRGGYVLYAHDQTLVARPFDAQRMRFTGLEFPISEVDNRALLEPLRADFSVSDTGALTCRSRRGADRLTWWDRNGTRLQTLGEAGVHLDISLSPVEKEVSFTRLEPHTGRYDIWRADLAGGAATRITYGPADQFDPVWSPDGTKLYYASTNLGYSSLHPDTTCQLREIGSDGHGDRLLLTVENLTAPWSTDGVYLLYHEIQNGRKMDSWALPLIGSKPIPLLQGPPNQIFPVFSPGGKWVAYSSDETGKWEVYVAAFSGGRAGPGKRVSDSGGSHPEWSRDGKQLYYLAADKRIMSVGIVTAVERFAAGAPRALFQSNIVNDFRARFAVTADGQRFLIPTAAGQAGPAVATVIVNWMSER